MFAEVFNELFGRSGWACISIWELNIPFRNLHRTVDNCVVLTVVQG